MPIDAQGQHSQDGPPLHQSTTARINIRTSSNNNNENEESIEDSQTAQAAQPAQTAQTAQTTRAISPQFKNLHHHDRLEFIPIPTSNKQFTRSIEAAAAKQGITWGMCHFVKPNIAYTMTRNQLSCPNGTRKFTVEPTLETIPSWDTPISHYKDHPYHNADTFVIVHNPYDRMILYYLTTGKNSLLIKDEAELTVEHLNHWIQTKMKDRLSIQKNDTLEYWKLGGRLVPQVDYVMDSNGTQLVTHFLQKETLKTSFPILMKNYGLNQVKLPKHFNKRLLFSVDNLDAATLLLIEQVYEQDFALFGYPTRSSTRVDQPSDTHPPRLEFVHIPKTGGTIIESMAAEAGIRWSICHFSTPEIARTTSSNNTHCPGLAPWALLYGLTIHTCPHWHLPPQYFELQQFPNNPFQNATLFAVVRNPYERILSEYFYMKKYAMNNSHTSAINLNLWVMHFLSLHSKGTRGDIANNVTGTKPYFVSAGHFIPQYDYVFEGSRQVIHHVLKFEQLQLDFDSLMAMYNMSLTLPQKSDNHMWKSVKDLTVQNMTPESIRMINTVYANDFQEFGYEMIL